MEKKLLIIICLFSIISAETEFNEYSNYNLELMLSPISVALGGADLSMNSGIGFGGSPSNLPYDSLNNLSLSYANYFQNTFSSSILSYNGPADSGGGFGITAGYVYIPDIEDNRDSPETENGTIVYDPKIKNCSDIFARFAYGHKFTINVKWDIAAGVAANARRTRLIDYSGYGIGLDAGLKVVHKPSGLSMVLQIDNITTHYTYWSEDYREYAYPHLRFGLGYEKSFQYIYGRIRIGYTSTDLLSNSGVNYIRKEIDTNDISVETLEHKTITDKPSLLIYDSKIGAEYTIMNRLALRIGLTQGKFNFGAGLQFFSNRAGLDFAYTKHQLAGTYQVSVRYLW